VAASADAVDLAEDGHAAFVVELRPGCLEDGDVAAAGRRSEVLDGQEGSGGLSGGVVGELEGSGRVAVGSLRCQSDVGFGIGHEAVGDPGGGRDLFEFAGGQESVDVVATPLPGHGVSSGLAGRA
jgi:hypothetical protein